MINTKKVKSVKKTLVLSLTLIFSLASVFSYPNIFYNIKSVFASISTEQDNGEKSSEVLGFNNSQDLIILSARQRFDKNLNSVGGGNITIVEEMMIDSYLAAEQNIIENKKSNNNGKISVYEVREGDTLSQIAEMFDVSVNTIRWANDFEGHIQPGQTLIILPVTGITHTVKNGGTIKDVAEIYDADVREIALFNGLNEDEKLEKGQVVIVPNVDPKIDEKTNNSNNNNSNQKTYTAKPGSAPASYYRNPVPGAILTQNLHGYNAVDIGAPIGTPIIASASGKVIRSISAGWNGGYGKYVVISHPNGTQTLYAHQNKVAVSVGQRVNSGEVIGYVGSSGNSTGPHIHFEVRGGVNPAASCRVGSVCN